MSTLLSIYKSKLFEICSDEGLAKAYTSQNLKKRPQNHFGKKIVFFQQGSVTAPELVFSSTVDIKDVINMAFHYRESLENLNVEREISAFNNADCPVNESLLFHASLISLILRSYIRNIEGINSQPLDPVDITLEKAESIVTNEIYNFLYWLLSTHSQVNSNIVDRSLVRESNPTIHRYIMSICQDLIYMASRGKTKNPKACWAQHNLSQDDKIERNSSTFKPKWSRC